MKEENAINRFAELIKRAEQLTSKSSDVQDLKKWYLDTQITIEKIFGSKTRHIIEFNKYGYSSNVHPLMENQLIGVYLSRTKSAITVLKK